MGKKYFNRKKLSLRPLEEREHEIDLSIIKDIEHNLTTKGYQGIDRIAERIISAKKNNSSVIMMMGAHVIRSGVQNYIIDLIEKGYITCLSVNGAAMIHDFELSKIGATTESVSKYIKNGQFGLWKETGAINDIVNNGYNEKIGIGEAIGREIWLGDYPYKNISIFAQAFKAKIPVTVHVSIGYDIIHQHPNFDGGATGAGSYLDFLTFTEVLRKLEKGVIMNFGSAVMAPEVFLKGLSMARNVALKNGKHIKHFSTLVCDLYDLPSNVNKEASKMNAFYYFRPWKTMLVRTVAEGGEGFYVKGRHENTIPILWQRINEKVAE
jgi:hypothetical protein